MPVELAVLIRCADHAGADARRLMAENDRWRRYAEQQLDALVERKAQQASRLS